MRKELLKAKLFAALIHFTVTAIVIGVAAWLVFYLWFPEPYSTLLGGTKLFLLIVVCDLVLGPVLTLVIYSPSKRKTILLFDYSVVGGLQIASLAFGLYVTAQTRPVVASFTVDRFDIVSAAEISDAELEKAQAPYNKHSWSGPIVVWAKQPDDPVVLSKITIEAIETGVDLQHRPSYYQPYGDAHALVVSKSRSLSDLPNKSPELKAAIDEHLLKTSRKAETIRWLPVKHKRGFATALIDAKQGTLFTYLPFDPS
jgi:hypothetical protein